MKDCCSSNKDKKAMDYIVIAVVLLLLVGSVIVGFGFTTSKEVVIEEDLDLDQYRGEGIPIDCRLPTYESRIESWKEHLSHHENTLYCLDYFE
jgi:hypothetical protein